MAVRITKEELLQQAERILEATRLMTVEQFICPACLSLGPSDYCYCDYDSGDFGCDCGDED